MQSINNLIKGIKTRSIFTGMCLSIALLVILNLVSSYFFYRIDLSKGNIHTLSDTSKRLARDLSDNVVVKVYLSRNLPPDFNMTARYAKDLLSDYRQYGKNRFRYEMVSQTNEDEFRAQASRDNIFAQRVAILENDQQTLREIYMGLAFEYRGNRESLNLTREIGGRLEYEITAILRRLTKASLPRVSVFQDTLYNSDHYQFFEHHLSQNYSVIPTNLTIPAKEASVLVFTGVVDSLSNLQLYNLDQFIMHGGRVIFLQDRVVGLVQYGSANVINSNLFKLLEHYGIEIKPNLALDQNCAPINMSQRSGIFVIDVPVLFPPIPIVHGQKTSEISKGLSDLLFYLSSEINTQSKNKNITITPILQTSPGSGIMQGPEFDLRPERFMQQRMMSALVHPPITLSALYSGSFTSYFADKPGIAGTEGFTDKVSNSEIIVVSDSDLVRDFIVSASSSNIMFVLNAIDYLLKDISLSEVRSRTIPHSPLEISRWLAKLNVEPERIVEIEPSVRQIVKGINLVVPSLLLIMFGLTRFVLLKKRRSSIQAEYRIAYPGKSAAKPIEEETEG